MHRRDRLRLLLREFGRVVVAVTATRSLAYPRLVWHAARRPRFTPGTLHLRFGDVRYLDALTVRTTYFQIFVERIYDTTALGATPTIVDCGGNIGLSVIAFKRRYPRARILTFEADPAIADLLARNIERLGLADVSVTAAAVGAADGVVRFVPNGADGGQVIANGGAGSRTLPAITAAIQVPAVRLSQQIEGPVDLLKLDVEGSEYDVIADLCETGRIAQVKALICEVHGNPQTQPRFAELWALLSRAGFRLSLRYARAGGEGIATPFAAIPGPYYAVLVYGWRT